MQSLTKSSGNFDTGKPHELLKVEERGARGEREKREERGEKGTGSGAARGKERIEFQALYAN